MQIVMPKLGLTMTEGTLVRWLVEPGQSVALGDILFEFESDKSAMEYEAPAAGVMGTLLVAAGTTVPCGAPLAVLETTTRPTPDAPPAELTGAPAASTAPAAGGPAASDGIHATPAARRLARALGVDLAGRRGRGPQGRVHVADVAAAEAIPDATPVARRLAAELAVDLAGLAGSGAGGRIARQDVLAAARAAASESGSRAPRVETPIPSAPAAAREPLRNVRRIIAAHVGHSARSAPHVTLHTEVDATNLVSARRQLNAELADGQKLSFNAMLISLVARALRHFPNMNACLVGDEHWVYAEINIGLAVDTPRGLLVPVVRQADRRSLPEIQRLGDELVQRALAGNSVPDDLSGGTFTITNLGMYDIDAFTPIINQPQAAILGVGRIARRPAEVDGRLALQQRLTLSLSFDHRLVDGAPAARFLQRVGQLVERPLALLLPDPVS